jgi:hypothetical protein
MSLATRARRTLAISTAVLVVSAGLAVAPLAVSAASAASASSNAAAVLKSINSYRASVHLAKLVPNGFVKAFAAEYAAGLARKNSLSAHPTPSTALPTDPESADNFGGPIVKVPKGTAASVYKYLRSFDTYEYGSGDFNYGAVGYASHGTTVYAVVVLLHFSTPPLDLLAASKPSITGSAKVGSPLVAHVSTNPSGATLSYQWKVAGTVTGGSTNSYTPVPADFGKSITVTTSAAKSGYVTTNDATSAVTRTVAHGTLATHSPVVTGKRNVGQTLTATAAAWGPGTVPLTWKWTRNGKTISGATDSSYLLTASDKAARIDAVATGSEDGYTTASVSSATKSLVAAPLLTSTPVPTINGSATVGTTLTITTGDWAPATVTLHYQWLVSGKAVSTATKSTFTIPASAKGKTVSVTVTGTKTGYTSASATSAKTVAVTEPLV